MVSERSGEVARARLQRVLRYALAILFSVAALVLSAELESHFHWTLFSIPIALTAMLAFLLGAGPGLLFAGVVGLGYWFFFQGTQYSFVPAGDREIAQLIAYTAAVLMTNLAIELSRRARLKAERANDALRASELRFAHLAEACHTSEREAQTRAAELQVVLDVVPAGVYIARQPSGSSITPNRLGCELLGLPYGSDASAEASSKPEWRFEFEGAALPAYDLPMQKAMRLDQEVRDREFDVVRPDGSRRRILGNAVPLHGADGRITGSVAAFVDITSRHRAEADLRASEAQFRQLSEAVPQLVWITGPDGYHEYFNSGWYAFTGLTLEESRGDGWTQVLHPDDVERTGERWRRSLETGAPYEVEYRFKRASDGAYRWFLGRAQPLRDSSGRIVRWFGTCTDIQDQKQAQADLAHAKAELEAADHRKDEFLALLSHELRNPLAPISNCLYVLDRAPCQSEQARRAKQVIERQVRHMTRLVGDLLDVSRIARGKIQLRYERLDLAQVVARTAEDFRTVFLERRVELAEELPREPVWVDGDGVRLAQAIGNLLQNAVKFTPEGGRVLLSLRRDGAQGVVQVRDTGIGITPEMLGQIFRPFTQADSGLARSAGGLGLGLALVKGLVELHGGEVAAASEGPGRGAEFTLKLPIELEPVASLRPEEAIVSHHPRRVLVVEDNSDAAESLKEALELNEHIVEVAASGPQALQKARSFAPDVVVCDIGLPEMDGYQVARAFRLDAELSAIPLVALSGHTLPEDQRRAASAGFNRHLAKPPDLAALERALAELH